MPSGRAPRGEPPAASTHSTTPNVRPANRGPLRRPAPAALSFRPRISQCKYNTALDLVRTKVPTLVVPYATPEEDEQTRRAQRLAKLGVVKVADHPDPALLDFTPEPTQLDLAGAATTTELLAR